MRIIFALSLFLFLFFCITEVFTCPLLTKHYLQTFTFDVRRPDLSYLTFHVNDEDVLRSDFVAFTSLPLSCIRTGLRTLHLRNAVGKRDQDFEYASLFVRVTKEFLE